MRVLLIRHARTAWNAERRVQGRTDTPLDKTGRAQAQALAGALRGRPFAAVYTSPLSRAVDTARQIAADAGVPLQEDKRLVEYDFGTWEGLTFDELILRYPEQMAESRKRPFTFHVPGAERPQDALARITDFLAGLPGTGQGAVAVVSHTLPIKIAIAHLLGLDYDNINALWLGNTGYTELNLKPQGRSLFYCINNTSHLTGDLA